MRLTGLASIATIFTLTVGASAHAQELPEGRGKVAVQSACTQCHGVDVITRQPRSRDEWSEVVARMIGSGAQLSDDDYSLVMDYLATHLGPPGAKAPAADRSTPKAAGASAPKGGGTPKAQASPCSGGTACPIPSRQQNSKSRN